MKNFKLLICICAILLNFTSCDSDVYSEYTSQESGISNQKDDSPKTWQEQLEYAKNLNKKQTKSNGGEIQLIGYTHKGTIKSDKEVETVVTNLFSDESFIVQYTDSVNFEIVSVKEAKDIFLNNENSFKDISSLLMSNVKVGMELIELEWLYKGKTFYSMAIASNKLGGIIYDSIGTFIITSHEKTTSNTQRNTISRKKTRSEVGNADSIQEFQISDKIKNGFGTVAAEYEIICISYFKNEILIDRDLNAYHTAILLWSCDADVRTLKGEIDESKYHEFAWGYVYGTGTCSLSFKGSGFTISGGGTGETGTEIHRS